MRTNTIYSLGKEKGSSAIETALLLALFCVVVIASVSNLGLMVNKSFFFVSTGFGTTSPTNCLQGGLGHVREGSCTPENNKRG